MLLEHNKEIYSNPHESSHFKYKVDTGVPELRQKLVPF